MKRNKEELWSDCIYYLVLSRTGMKFTKIIQKVNYTTQFKKHLEEMINNGLIAHIPYGSHGYYIYTKEGVNFMIKNKKVEK